MSLKFLLEKYGLISRNLIIDDPASSFYRSAIIEFSHRSAVENIRSLLPLTLESVSDPSVTYRVRALATVYTQTATEGYLEELKAIAKDSGRSFHYLSKLMGTLQNQNERPSDYLHRLQVILSAAIRRGGVAEVERDCYLLKQFCRGCWDDRLITDLQLGKKEAHPPTFAELLVLIRTQEDKHASKDERMLKVAGSVIHVSACSCDVSNSAT